MSNNAEKDNAALFSDWAQSGRGVTMAHGHRELVDFTLKRWSPHSKDAFLDIGCGVGLATAAALKAGFKQVAGVDIAPQMISKARELVPEGDFRVASGESLSWPSNCFSHVLSVESLYYHTNPVRTLHEANRVLNTGGRVAIAIEFYKDNCGSKSWPIALGLPMHNWSEARWQKAFEEAGFHDVNSRRIVRNEDLHTPDNFEPGPFFPTYEDYKAYLEEGALWVEGMK